MNAPGLVMRTDGAVRILVNSNPAAKNAITPALYDALPAALEAALMCNTGVTISCSDTPPCEYSMPARKLPTPGGLAIITSGFQCQWKASASVRAPSFNAAQRLQRVSVRKALSSTLGRPPGSSSQP